MTQPNNITEVLEEFDKTFPNLKWETTGGTMDIRDFIRTQFTALLEKMRMEERKDFPEEIIDRMDGYNSAVEQINKTINKLSE